MKETRDPEPRRAVHRVSREELLTELYRVACYFHASPKLSSREDEIDRIPAPQLLVEAVQEKEIARSLLVASIQMRLLDELLWQSSDAVKQRVQTTVGLLWEPENSVKAVDLSLREACNKIVHADDFGFFVDETQYDPDKFGTPRFLKPRLASYGKRGKNAWRAEIDVDQFVAGGYWLAVMV